jgi:hypothetical protein
MFDVYCGGKLCPKHEFTEAFLDLFAQILDEIRVCDAVDGPPECILLCQIRKTAGNICKRAVDPVSITSVENYY